MFVVYQFDGLLETFVLVGIFGRLFLKSSPNKDFGGLTATFSVKSTYVVFLKKTKKMKNYFYSAKGKNVQNQCGFGFPLG